MSNPSPNDTHYTQLLNNTVLHRAHGSDTLSISSSETVKAPYQIPGGAHLPTSAYYMFQQQHGLSTLQEDAPQQVQAPVALQVAQPPIMSNSGSHEPIPGANQGNAAPSQTSEDVPVPPEEMNSAFKPTKWPATIWKRGKSSSKQRSASSSANGGSPSIHSSGESSAPPVVKLTPGYVALSVNASSYRGLFSEGGWVRWLQDYGVHGNEEELWTIGEGIASRIRKALEPEED